MDRIIRPDSTVLPDSAMVPEENILRPAPDRFTHEIVADQPYFYAGPQQASPPDGTFASGTKVLLLTHDGGPLCRVADDRGICVFTAFAGLRPLP